MIGLLMLAEMMSGDALYERCSGDRADSKICAAYVTGVVDGAKVSSNLPNATRLFCLPGDWPEDMVVQDVRDFMDARPNSRKYAAPLLIITALREAHNCNKSGG